MRIILLGTGDSPGTPVIGCHCKTCEDAKRNGWERKRFSILIQHNGKNMLIDTSPDMRKQLLLTGVERVDAVIWTHSHYDHFAGFGEFYRVQKNVTVYSSPEVHEDIAGFMSFMKYKAVEIESYRSFDFYGLKVTLIDVNHPPLRKAHGVVIEDGNVKVSITGDTNKDIPKTSMEFMENSDLLIIDAIAPGGYKLKKHMNAVDALRISERLKAKNVVFTHIGHFYPVKNNYPLGHDFQTFDFKRVTLDDFVWD